MMSDIIIPKCVAVAHPTVVGWDLHDKPYSLRSDAGDGETMASSDLLASVDLLSFRRIPWEDRIPFFLLDFKLPSTDPFPYCPRSLLRNVILPGSWVAVAGVEFEWFNYKETPETLVEKKFMGLDPLTPGMFGYSLLRPTQAQDFFYDIFDQCSLFGVRIECLHTETGPGVYEAALKYAPALELADAAQLFKTSCKQLGALRPHRHPGQPAIYPSFMAKPNCSLPGCSGHLHVSLMNSDRTVNLFHDASDPIAMSDLFKHFLAGVLKCMPDLMPMYAPNVNSYKRLVENFWAPVYVCWGAENRTAAVRVITPAASGSAACSAMGTRAEIRVPGADMNVYLALSAVFASGQFGIQQKLPLPERLRGDVTQDQLARGNVWERLPRDLGEATERMMRTDSVAWRVLPAEFVRNLGTSRREEWLRWQQQVTQWEVERYFELV